MGGLIQVVGDMVGFGDDDEQDNSQTEAQRKAAERARQDALARQRRAQAATKKLREQQALTRERAAKQRAAERKTAQEQGRQQKAVASGGKMGLLNFANQNNASLGQLLTTLG